MIYLDNAATTFPKSEKVYQTMDDVNRRLAVNAGRGSYALAREATALIQKTKKCLADMVKADGMAEIVFTASATLAFNAIIGGINWQGDEVVYVSPYEHNAVMRTLYGYHKKYHFSIRELPLCEDLSIDLERMSYLFAQTPPQILFLNMVSNVTGYVLPTDEIVACAKQYKCNVILDAAQALGMVPIDLREIGADFLVFAGHKALGGPFGVGGFIRQGSYQLHPVLYGGTGSNSLALDMPEGEEGFEPGSPNIVAIAGLYAALEEIRDGTVRKNNWEKEKHKRKILVDGLSRLSSVKIYGTSVDERQAGIVSINLEGYRADELGMLLDEDYGIAVRTGYHCAPLIHRYLNDEIYGGTVRISLGHFTTPEDVQELITALQELEEM